MHYKLGQTQKAQTLTSLNGFLLTILLYPYTFFPREILPRNISVSPDISLLLDLCKTQFHSICIRIYLMLQIKRLCTASKKCLN